jgi:pyruvate/2-oxoglutarate dehydrogenase complex dihydrolipoamide dehydrogenase (E3) component
VAPGAAEGITGGLDPKGVFSWRDQVADGRDDSWHAGWLEEQGAELVRGEARVVRPGAVEVDGREIEYEHLVVATGSTPAVPRVEGIADVDYWTNRDAVWTDRVPASLVVLGGGPVGVELAQFFHRMGSEVTLVEHNDRILAGLDAAAGALLRERFEQEGYGSACPRPRSEQRRTASRFDSTSARARRSRSSDSSSRSGGRRTCTGSGSRSSASRSRRAGSPSTGA